MLQHPTSDLSDLRTRRSSLLSLAGGAYLASSSSQKCHNVPPFLLSEAALPKMPYPEPDVSVRNMASRQSFINAQVMMSACTMNT